VSSAIGAAAAHPGPVLVILGDLSFLHDLNALVGARVNRIDLTVLVVDNDGGGIFSFLPQATVDAPGAGLPERFERLFGVPHGTGAGIGRIAEALGTRSIDLAPGPHDPTGDRDALVASVRDAMTAGGTTVVRYASDRERNLALHREVAAAVRTALDALVDTEATR
jgi:2-succinyl-5-enolpyruvyl-6-hydroxy-3-cyclohexene-1-carboxylate synthase